VSQQESQTSPQGAGGSGVPQGGAATGGVFAPVLDAEKRPITGRRICENRTDHEAWVEFTVQEKPCPSFEGLFPSLLGSAKDSCSSKLAS
jgi:hypothetical protein